MIHFIRSMRPDDIEFAVVCTRGKGWSGQTHLVLEDFLGYDPQGCFIAEVDGHRVGICVATTYQHHGFIGMLIVVTELRGGGLGTDLFTDAIRLDRGRCVQSWHTHWRC